MTNFWLYMCDMGRNGGTVDERKISMTGSFGSVLGTGALIVYPVILATSTLSEISKTLNLL